MNDPKQPLLTGDELVDMECAIADMRATALALTRHASTLEAVVDRQRSMWLAHGPGGRAL